MILTITSNPSVDVSYILDDLVIDQANRVQSVRKTAGGKGLNVSRVIHQLDGNVLATGFIGGHFGYFIQDKLNEDGVPHHFTLIEGESRSCIALLHQNNQTEVLEKGPEIKEKEAANFINTYKELLENEPIKVVTISGSLPKGLNNSFYIELIKIAAEKDIPVLLDCSGQTLKDAIQAEVKPYFIKPNVQEISELLNLSHELTTDNLREALLNPIFNDIPNVMVSLGSKGALVKCNGKFYLTEIPKVEAVNSVGSGDSTIAGMAYAIDNEQSFIDQIRTGMTCGILNAMNPLTGNIDINHFQTIYDQVKVKQID